MKTADIIFLIDIQNGFARKDLTRKQGGSLYVPDGEKAGKPAANLIALARDAVVVLSMDFHPDGIISDMTNHPGIMALRQKQAKALGVDAASLPFTNVYLREIDGRYKVVGAVVDDKVMAVATDVNGYVTAATEQEAVVEPADMMQTLWTKHCVQRTKSALFVPDIMNALPGPLAYQIYRHDPSPSLTFSDEQTNNIFFVVRKGMRMDVDSNAIAVENNRKSFTTAINDFAKIADVLQKRGVTDANISIGGLAGNICAELSHNDLYSFLVPLLQAKGIKSQVSFMTDISPNIPIAIPGGAFPDAANALTRMSAYGTKQTVTEDVLRSMVRGVKANTKGPEVIM